MNRLTHWARKYLIPHAGNEFKPHALRDEAAFAILALILVIEGAFLAQALVFGRGSGFLALVLPNTLVDQTNQQRLALSLPTLRENPVLAAAAQMKANDMAAKGYFAHTSPEGLTPWYWFQRAGYKYVAAGENLAVNFSDSRDVTEAWMKSTTHRANIVNGSYTEIGIATAQGTYQGAPTIFVVQMFGKPAAPRASAPTVAVNPTPKPATPKPATPRPATPRPTIAATPTPTPATPRPATPRPSTPEPTIAPTPVPVIVPVTSTDSLPQPAFVAIEGAASGTVVAGTASTTTEPPAAIAATQPRSNFVQRMLASPRLTTNIVYGIIALMIVLALALNVFIKVEVQHPRLVLNGLTLLFVLGTLAVFNQQLLLANAQIF